MRHLLSFVITAVLCTSLSPSARAEELVVGSFGGSFADNVKACHVAAFEKATGATVSLKLGNSSQFAAAIRATGGKPDMDVVFIDNSLAAQTHGEKLNETHRPEEADPCGRGHSDRLGQGRQLCRRDGERDDAHLQSEARQDAADFLARSVRSCLCRQVCDRRHQRHFRRCSFFLR